MQTTHDWQQGQDENETCESIFIPLFMQLRRSNTVQGKGLASFRAINQMSMCNSTVSSYFCNVLRNNVYANACPISWSQGECTIERNTCSPSLQKSCKNGITKHELQRMRCARTRTTAIFCWLAYSCIRIWPWVHCQKRARKRVQGLFVSFCFCFFCCRNACRKLKEIKFVCPLLKSR